MSTDTLWFGDIFKTSVGNIGYDMTSTSPSCASELASRHPGFSVQPTFFCAGPGSSGGSSGGGGQPFTLPDSLFVVSSPAGLAASLLQVTTILANSTRPADVSAAWQTVWPATLIVSTGVDLSGVVQLAASQGGSVSV